MPLSLPNTHAHASTELLIFHTESTDLNPYTVNAPQQQHMASPSPLLFSEHLTIFASKLPKTHTAHSHTLADLLHRNIIMPTTRPLSQRPISRTPYPMGPDPSLQPEARDFSNTTGPSRPKRIVSSRRRRRRRRSP